MNWLDIVLIIAIMVPTIIGLWVGIIRTVLFAAGSVAGIILAARYNDPVAGWLAFISQPQLARVVAFALILLAITLAAMLIATILKRVATMLMLGWINRLLGAALGFLTAAIFWGGLLALWVRFAGVSGPIVQSIIARVLLEHFPVVWQYFENLPG